MNIEDLERYLNKYLHMPPHIIKAEIERADVTAIEAMIGNIVLAAIKGADHMRLDFLLNRLVGRVPEKVQSEGVLTIRSLPSIIEARQILAADPAAQTIDAVEVEPLETEP